MVVSKIIYYLLQNSRIAVFGGGNPKPASFLLERAHGPLRPVRVPLENESSETMYAMAHKPCGFVWYGP